jgi:hypothetical protein
MNVSDRISGAFPQSLKGQSEALGALFASKGGRLSPDSFSVIVKGDVITIPERVYVDENVMAGALNGLGDALLTRHHNGFVRQRALGTVLGRRGSLAVPFMVRLIGEYVLEILDQIDEQLDLVSRDDLVDFVTCNPDFMRLTHARVTSYWACYFGATPRQEHVGFRLIERIEALGRPR